MLYKRSLLRLNMPDDIHAVVEYSHNVHMRIGNKIENDMTASQESPQAGYNLDAPSEGYRKGSSALV
jgi:hypothetical protein